jgi:hypothetical protein
VPSHPLKVGAFGIFVLALVKAHGGVAAVPIMMAIVRSHA